MSYNRYVVDKYVSGDSDTVIAGDPFGVSLHFHAGNLLPSRPSFVRGPGSGFRRGGRQSWQTWQEDRDKDYKDQSAPSLEGFPEDVC